MKAQRRLARITPTVLLVTTLGLFYFRTLAPDITWANQGSDGGDLITAAATGGVAHPSGYPTYLVLARLFQAIPMGTLAFRTNLMSAVCALIAAVIFADLVQRTLPDRLLSRRWVGMLAGLGFGLTTVFWSQAVITEVYALHAVFVVLILWFLLAGDSQFARFPSLRSPLVGLTFGLGMGNHLSILFLLPAWLLLNLMDTKTSEGKVDLRSGLALIFRQLGWMVAGLGIYLTLPINAQSGSPINWGNPADLAGFWWLVSGQLYQGLVFGLPLEALGSRMVEWMQLLLSQYGLVGFFIALSGVLYGKLRTKRALLISGYLFICYTVFAIGYDVPDWFVLTIPAFIGMGLWFGWGVASLLDLVSRYRDSTWFASTMIVSLAGVVLFAAASKIPAVDASQDREAVAFASRVLSNLPQNALVVTSDNEDTFTLWYYHYALGERGDIAVINAGSLVYDWYRDRMLLIYPDLVLSDHKGCYPCMMLDLIGENDRPVCETLLGGSDPLHCQPWPP